MSIRFLPLSASKYKTLNTYVSMSMSVSMPVALAARQRTRDRCLGLVHGLIHQATVVLLGLVALQHRGIEGELQMRQRE